MDGFAVIQELARFLTGRDGSDCFFLLAPEFRSLA